MFKCGGDPVWQRKFPSPVNCIEPTKSGRKLAVGLENGVLCLMSANGELERSRVMRSPVVLVKSDSENVYAVSEQGVLEQLRIQ